MGALYTVARKELLLLGRDLHGLLLLFALPLVFILIMSLAMQDEYATNAGNAVDVLVMDHDRSDASRDLLASLGRNEGYRLQVREDAGAGDRDRLLNDGGYAFLVEIKPGLGDFARMTARPAGGYPPVVTVLLPARTPRQQEKIFTGLLQESLGRLRLSYMVDDMIALDPELSAMSRDELMGVGAVETAYLFGGTPKAAPSAVQQNVPAWLIFSIFFIVVPLSNTFINERLLGTINRMRTINVPPAALILGKMIPYFIVNQVQVVLMLLVGVYVVPWCGGERLLLGDSPSGLMVMSLCVSWAALGYAVIIAVVARTPEQAVTLGGMGNIILAAIGGIMVPAFIMPEVMQSLSVISPMAWALRGFLDVLLHGGGIDMIWPECGLLILFGSVCMFLAVKLYFKIR